MQTEMDYWQPGPGEILLTRTPVTFASGAAARVRGMRWFRDTERNDIQNELPGWPAGRVYAARSGGGALGLGILRTVALTLGNLVVGVISSFGGLTVDGNPGSNRTDDRVDEIDDFPVMWAAPGTIARTLPWQLDPGRAKQKHYRTHAIVTDRRLVVVGLPFKERDSETVEDEVLWEIPLSAIGTIERRNFKGSHDVKVVFADGSWCRLNSFRREGLTRHIVDQPDLVPLDSLTPAQRDTAEAFVAAQAPDAGAPVVTQNLCGCYRVAAVAPSTAHGFFGISDLDMLIDADGTEADIGEYHWEDYSPDEQEELRSARHFPPSALGDSPR
ncbi:hypothetical protein OHS59_25905 [Streptomyces sp. NBC_00414]|uniref:hypothetical protein n=1 Tax=Streptomyces sp. NBC_00414 TaxID=2975739 RepID=UPI002E1E23AA